jgi:hypothetical protein
MKHRSQATTERNMKNIAAVAATLLMVALPPLIVGTPALTQSATGEVSSGGIAGGDSFGSEGSARGGNGPSQTGVAASGGVAGGNPPDNSGDAAGVAAAAGASGSASVDATATGSTSDPEQPDPAVGIESCGSEGRCR